MTAAGALGEEIEVCVPVIDLCVPPPPPVADIVEPVDVPAVEPEDAGAPACPGFAPPDEDACCAACNPSNPLCQANRCYGGWYCNLGTCKCKPPPDGCGASEPPDAGPAIDVSPPPDVAPPPGKCPLASGSGGAVTASGGTLDRLAFAVVGDTRPAIPDDTEGYPTAVIQGIWKAVQAEDPRPPFAVATGDYVYATTWGAEMAPQLGLYLGARAAFQNPVFFAVGNHECNGLTKSNCGEGTKNGLTSNYEAYLAKMVTPLGKEAPWYSIPLSATDGSWTAKIVLVAANAWTDAQAAWLETALSVPTTYTFVIRHEDNEATKAPGTVPSSELIYKHPLTLLIVGHTHTYEHHPEQREVIVGTGGAPLSGFKPYGYAVARQRTDCAIEFTTYGYAKHDVVHSFAILPDGSPAP